MILSSLNVDVLLYLMKFVEPVDRFNLALSGILKGFENVINRIDLHERIEGCGAELGLRRDSTCELEIRSLTINDPPDESLLKILERLAGEGYLQNNRRLNVEFDCSQSSRFVELICSMKNLKTLRLFGKELTLEDLAHLFQSCSQLNDLFIPANGRKMSEVAEHLKNQLRAGFQKLRRLGLKQIDDDSWPVIQEMLTWLKKCVELSISNNNYIINIASRRHSFVTDDSLTLDPNLAKSLKIAEFWNVPAALVKWILSVSLNIHTLRLHSKFVELNGLHNEIVRLKKLKELEVSAYKASDLKEIVRSCRQVEILWAAVSCLTLTDLAELEPAENTTNISLHWFECPYIKEVFPIIKRWRHLTRLTLSISKNSPNNIFPPFEVLSNFIVETKHLSYFDIIVSRFYDGSNDDQLEILRDKVNELILPLRPNFKFDISRSDY